MVKKNILIGILVTFYSFLLAQNSSDSLKIGDWRSYLPYQNCRSVTQSTEHVMVASDFAIMMIDKEDNSLDFTSKVEGLSDAGIQLIKYNKFSEILFVAYSNSNIDLIDKNGKITNLRDIADNINIIGDKKIYDVFIKDANTAYLACGFGVLKLNMVRGEFGFTTFTNAKVQGINIWENKIYAATEKGLFSISDNQDINAADFTLWTNVTKTLFPKFTTYGTRNVAVYKNKMYFDVNDSLYVYDKTSVKKIFAEAGTYISSMSAEGKNLLITVWKTQPGGEKWGGKLFFIDENENFNNIPNSNDCIVDLYYAIEDNKGQIWLADIERGIKKMDSVLGNCKYVSTNSPYTSNVEQMELENGNLWVASGGYTVSNSYDGNAEGFYYNIDGKWGYKNRTNDVTMRDGYLYTLHTVTSVAVNEKAKRRFIGSFWGGLLETDDKGAILKHYTSKNSTLQNAIGDQASTRVGGIAFDKKGTLWISNNSAAKPISALTPDGKWHVMGSAFPNAQIYKVTVDPNTGYKWFIIGKGSASIIVYDEGKLIDDESDDRSIVLSATNSQLPGSKVNWIEPDLDGKMWVATDDGVIWFSCGSSIFDKNTKKDVCNGSLPTTVVDGIPESLLKYNNVNTIAIDGANRKWFGTSNGLFIQSADGKSQIAYFDKANSPLFDNNVIDIAINNKTGEVFIATNKGIQSIKTDALLGAAINSTIVVYPNPVRPEYDGVIAIKGVAQDANIKITDVNGRLVYETEALGGQAIWNGKDYNGNTVEKGVYLIFSTYTKNIEYPDEAVAKLLIMR
jgi:ligand-binding sensor domain-containing protein